MSGADISGNCSVSTHKKRENCSIEYHNCIFVDKIFDDIFCAGDWISTPSSNLIFFYKMIQIKLSAWYTKEKKWTDSIYFLQLCFIHHFDNNID